jgi:hypothetical protein
MQIEFSKAELILINNALNEVCNSGHIPDWEFHTRLGTEKAEALRVLDQIKIILG